MVAMRGYGLYLRRLKEAISSSLVRLLQASSSTIAGETCKMLARLAFCKRERDRSGERATGGRDEGEPMKKYKNRPQNAIRSRRVRARRQAREEALYAFDALPDLEELAAAQGVTSVDNFDDLLGDFWPEDESVDDFLEARERWRREGQDLDN